jgi:hypothetical protein
VKIMWWYVWCYDFYGRPTLAQICLLDWEYFHQMFVMLTHWYAYEIKETLYILFITPCNICPCPQVLLSLVLS